MLRQLGDIDSSSIDLDCLSSNQNKIIVQMLYLPQLMIKSYQFSKPHFLSQAILKVCHDFNSFYSNSEKIIDMDPEKKYTNYLFLRGLVRYFDNFFEVINMYNIEKI